MRVELDYPNQLDWLEKIGVLAQRLRTASGGPSGLPVLRSVASRPRADVDVELMRRMEDIGHCQIIMATHSPMLMAYPNATLLRLTKYGFEPVIVKDTDHYKVMREFCEDPKGFVDAAIVE